MTTLQDHRPLMELVSLAESYRLVTLPDGFAGWPAAKQQAWALKWLAGRKEASDAGDRDSQRLTRFACWKRIFPPAIELPPVLGPGDKPRIVHLMTWPMGIGGAPRMVHEWCQACRDAWDVHVVTTGTAGLWDWSGVRVWSCIASEAVAQLIGILAPDVVVNHTPFEPATREIQAPQVWIMHGMPFLRKAPPAGVRPVCVFSNLDAPDIHPGWLELDWRVLPVGVDLRRFIPWT